MSQRRVVNVDDGVDLSVRILGEGPTDVLLVHGWMVSGQVWQSMLARIDPRGLRLIVPDQRGTGESSKPATNYTLNRYVDDLVALLDKLESTRCIVIGHSMGGQLALSLAARESARVRAAMVLCPVPPAGLALPPDAAALFRTCAHDRDKQRTILSLACTALSEAERDRLLDDSMRTAAACIEQSFDAWTSGGIEAQMSSVQANTLVLATDDPFLPPAFLRESVQAKLARARLAVLPGAGHYPQCERPAETAAIVESFITAAMG